MSCDYRRHIEEQGLGEELVGLAENTQQQQEAHGAGRSSGTLGQFDTWDLFLKDDMGRGQVFGTLAFRETKI